MESLTRNEIEVMNLFWSSEASLSKSDVVNLSTQRSWKEKSVHVLLNSLLAKEMIEVDGFASTRTNYGRTFRARCSIEEYLAFMLQAGGRPVKISISRLLSALRASGAIDEATAIDELEEALQELKGQKQSKK